MCCSIWEGRPAPVLTHLYNVLVSLLLCRKNLEAGAAGKGDKIGGDEGEVDHHDPLNPQAVLYLLLIPPFPLHLLLFLLILLYDVWKASKPSLLSCREL